MTYFLLSITYTAINIPYCSLGTVMTADPKERVACQSYRFVMVGIATLLLSLTLLPMADWFGGADKAKGYQMAMTVLAFIGMCMFLFCFATVRERIRPAVQTNDELKKRSERRLENDQWVRILLLTLCNVCPGFIRMAATMYYVTGDGTKHPFCHPVYQPRRSWDDDWQHAGESPDRPLVQTAGFLLDQYRAGRVLLRLLFL